MPGDLVLIKLVYNKQVHREQIRNELAPRKPDPTELVRSEQTRSELFSSQPKHPAQTGIERSLIFEVFGKERIKSFDDNN